MSHTPLQRELKKYFGFSEFKGLQEPVIENLLEGKDSFVIMPTGGGKSLCYQLPALFHRVIVWFLENRRISMRLFLYLFLDTSQRSFHHLEFQYHLNNLVVFDIQNRWLHLQFFDWLFQIVDDYLSNRILLFFYFYHTLLWFEIHLLLWLFLLFAPYSMQRLFLYEYLLVNLFLYVGYFC